MLDYYAISQRIRRFRKTRSFSQEQLAEKAGISVTHMSHIETGNTKLSLQVLSDLTQALDVTADELLFDRPPERAMAWNALAETVEHCTARELRILTDLSQATLESLKRHE